MIGSIRSPVVRPPTCCRALLGPDCMEPGARSQGPGAGGQSTEMLLNGPGPLGALWTEHKETRSLFSDQWEMDETVNLPASLGAAGLSD